MTNKVYKTGEINLEKEVYIVFPEEYENMTGFYSYELVEEYAAKYFLFAPIVKKYVTSDYKEAISKLYKVNNKPIPFKVKKFLGM